MRRSIISSSIGLGMSAALLAGCHHPLARLPERLERVPQVVTRSFEAERVQPSAPAPTQPPKSIMASEESEVAFYDLMQTFGLEVSIDLVTGRRLCTDEVNKVVVMPSARSITVNGREHTLEAPVRWKDGTLFMPGQARSILAMNLRSVPIPDVSTDSDLFDGSEVDLAGWRASDPKPAAARRSAKGGDTSLPTAWRVSGRRDWQYIVIHHSATDNGGAESFGREHKKKWPNGLGYHFVIGNGTDTGDGQIEVGPRWTRQGEGIDGAHAGNERYNKLGIGICLVGDFNGSRPTPAQLASLRRLVKALMAKYGIGKDHISPHCDVRRGHTDCPGKNFSFEAFVRSL